MPEPDWVVVDELVAGQRAWAYLCERREAAMVLLRRRGLRDEPTNAEIARCVGLSTRSIERYAVELGLPNRDNRKGRTGETREQIKQMILANPRMSASRAGRLLGIGESGAVAHVKSLVDAGELPARGKDDIDNPRWRGYDGTGTK